MTSFPQSLNAVRQSARLALSHERVWLVALPAVTGLTTALLAPGYGDTYASPQDLARAVASAQVSDTLSFLYGRLSETAGHCPGGDVGARRANRPGAERRRGPALGGVDTR